MNENPSSPNFNLETALKDLEEIVSHMEKDVLSIESALSEFEKGIRLIRRSQKALQEAEQKVSQLIQKNGETTLEPYSIEESES